MIFHPICLKAYFVQDMQQFYFLIVPHKNTLNYFSSLIESSSAPFTAFHQVSIWFKSFVHTSISIFNLNS